MPNPTPQTLLYAPGSRLRVTQQTLKIPSGYAITIEGKLLRQERQASGSWFAGNRHAKLWLDRLILEKPDGEISVLNLDQYSRIEVLEGPPPTLAPAPLVLPPEDAIASIT